MPSSYTTRNRLEKQNPGENQDSWGTLLNTMIDLVDATADGVIAFALSTTKTLSTASGTTDEARCRIINITSGSGGTVTIPNLEKAYIARNGSSGDVIFTTGSGTTATLKTGAVAWIISTGANIVYKGVVNLADTTSITGTLPVANGGTGVTTSTGSTNLVLSASPTLTGTTLTAAITASGTITANVAGDTLSLNNTSGSTLINCSLAGVLKYRISANGTSFEVQDGSSNPRFTLTTGATPAIQLNGTPVLTTRQTGWTAATNTKARTTFDTTSVTLPNLAARVGALIDDLISHGLIGT